MSKLKNAIIDDSYFQVNETYEDKISIAKDIFGVDDTDRTEDTVEEQERFNDYQLERAEMQFFSRVDQ